MKEEQPQNCGISADETTGGTRPKRILRKILRRLAIGFILFLLAFTVFDVLVWKGAGVRSVRHWHGRREMSVHDVKYELSGDRTEIVICVEEQFGVAISEDEAETLTTPRKIVEFLMSKGR